MINKRGLSTEPWWTPTLTPNSLLLVLFTLTLLPVLLYVACTNCTIHSSTPSFRMAPDNFFSYSIECPLKVNKCDVQFPVISQMFFWQLSEDECCINSVQTRHEVKFHVTDECSFPDDLFHHSLNSFQGMIKEFKASVFTSYQIVTFPFSSQMEWYHFLCHSKFSNQPYTSITGSLKHFSNYSQAYSSFAIFHLGNSFRHHLDSYEYGRASNSVSSQVLRIVRELFIQKTLIVLFPSNFVDLVVDWEVTWVILDTFVTNHILVVTFQLLWNIENVIHPRFYAIMTMIIVTVMLVFHSKLVLSLIKKTN